MCFIVLYKTQNSHFTLYCLLLKLWSLQSLLFQVVFGETVRGGNPSLLPVRPNTKNQNQRGRKMPMNRRCELKQKVLFKNC